MAATRKWRLTAAPRLAGGEIRRARWATSMVFAVHGAVTGNFAARVPWIATHVGVGVGRLGLALLMPGIGAMSATPFAGRMAHRYAGQLWRAPAFWGRGDRCALTPTSLPIDMAPALGRRRHLPPCRPRCSTTSMKM